MKNKKHSTKTVIKNNWFIIRYAFHVAPGYVFMTLFYTALQQLVTFFAYTYGTKYVLDSIQLGRPFVNVLVYLLSAFGAMTMWYIGFHFYDKYFKRKHMEKLARAVQFDVLGKAARLDLASYDDPEFFDEFVLAISESKNRIPRVLEACGSLLRCFVVLFSMGILMFSFDVFGFIFVAIAFFGSMLINKWSYKLQFKLQMALRPMQRREEYATRMLYLRDYAKEMRLNDIKPKVYTDYERANAEKRKVLKKHTRMLAVLSFLSQYVLTTLLYSGVYLVYLCYITFVTGRISLGTMSALFQGSERLSHGFRWLTWDLSRISESSLYIAKLRHFLDDEPAIHDGTDEVAPGQDTTLAMRGVSFAHGDGTQVLRDIDLSIAPREKIAIVGHNGAGKTTLVNLLLRLYDPTAGDVQFGGKRLSEYKLDRLRQQFGVVFQDHEIFAATLGENVAMDVKIDEKKTLAALAQVGFANKLKSLKNGLATQMTEEFVDDGTELSGGEAQKVAIARALYKDSSVLVLDEPSSALDPEAEYLLNNTIVRQSQDKTVIFISHRLSTTRMADRIIMLENGKIIEQGKHDELMKANGKYAEMFEMQAKRYRVEAQTED